jgi:uncharacterized membrane protein
VKEVKALGWLAVSIVAAAVVKTMISYLFEFLIYGPGSMTIRGIIAFVGAALITYAVWAIVVRFRR